MFTRRDAHHPQRARAARLLGRLSVLGLLALLAACAEQSSSTPGGEGPPAADPHWPGGSLGGFESVDGVEEAWTHGGGGPGAGGGGPGEGGAPDAGGGAWEGDERGAGGAGGEGGRAPVEGGGGAPLEGGEIDDNLHFEDFLEFAAGVRARQAENPMLHWLDVSRRHFVVVEDQAGRRVPDATVRIALEDEILLGRTRADGRYAFFPRAYGSDAARYAVQVEGLAGAGEGAIVAGEEVAVVRLAGTRAAAPLRLDVAFIVDATGSMGEEIDRIKTTLTDMAARISDSPHAPDLRLGLVSYRDFGDEYVTHTVDFTPDVPAFQRVVDGLVADGGGDYPEALNEALHEGMRRLSWRQEPSLRLAFIVADAPAAHRAQAPYTYDDALLDAAVMGVKLFPIASGGSDEVAELQFRQLAQFTLGHFIFITEGGGSSAGSGGSEYEVDPGSFQVQRLDDLVVNRIEAEMAAWAAAPPEPL